MTRTICDVQLICEDGLPLEKIASHGTKFVLSWNEQLAGGWARHVRVLGVEGRQLVGKGPHDRTLLTYMGFNPDDYQMQVVSEIPDKVEATVTSWHR